VAGARCLARNGGVTPRPGRQVVPVRSSCQAAAAFPAGLTLLYVEKYTGLGGRPGLEVDATGVATARQPLPLPTAPIRLFRRGNQPASPCVLKPARNPSCPDAGFDQRATKLIPAGLARTFAMSLLISVLITFVVVILVLYLVNLLPIDGRAKQIVRVVVIIIGVLSLLRYLAVF
jgi:hypothetical protein